jgi:septal ring factor EnvC (AmiA/AmiB activator)
MMRFALLFWLVPTGLFADSSIQLAQRAFTELSNASSLLQKADKASDRIDALTKAVRAYETGLAALREGMRQTQVTQEQLGRVLEKRETELGDFLAVLSSIRPGETPQGFLHPSGVVGAAQASAMLADLTPVLAKEAQNLRQDVEDLATIAALQEQGRETLARGLQEIQTARLSLNAAVADRTDLPYRFIADPVRAGLLIAATDTLEAFASGLDTFVTDDLGWTPSKLDERIGDLPLPVLGRVIRYPGEADAAGIARPGLVVAARPGALVTSPFTATLRYVGPLLDLGQVVILEPRPNTLLVLAGLEVTYGAAGQILPEGSPVGMMRHPQNTPSNDITSTGGEKGGVSRPETLYIEVRQDNTPQDPTVWFRTDKDD